MNAQWRKQFEKQKTHCNKPDNGLCQFAQCECARALLVQQLNNQIIVNEPFTYFATLCSEHHCFHRNNLHKSDPQQMVEFFKRKLAKIPQICNVLGVVDYQYTQYRDSFGWQDPYWLWRGHLHCFIQLKNNQHKRSVSKQLNQILPCSYYVQMPEYLQTITDRPFNTGYLVKYLENTHQGTVVDGVSIKCQWTIKGKALCEMKQHMQAYPLRNWILDYGKKESQGAF